MDAGGSGVSAFFVQQHCAGGLVDHKGRRRAGFKGACADTTVDRITAKAAAMWRIMRRVLLDQFVTA